VLIPDHEPEIRFPQLRGYLATVVDLLNSNRVRPLTMGIHGVWGAGKSSIPDYAPEGLCRRGIPRLSSTLPFETCQAPCGVVINGTANC
jgi:hypothetical protein